MSLTHRLLSTGSQGGLASTGSCRTCNNSERAWAPTRGGCREAAAVSAAFPGANHGKSAKRCGTLAFFFGVLPHRQNKKPSSWRQIETLSTERLQQTVSNQNSRASRKTLVFGQYIQIQPKYASFSRNFRLNILYVLQHFRQRISSTSCSIYQHTRQLSCVPEIEVR